MSITEARVGAVPDGDLIEYTVTAPSGMTLRLLNYGATVTSLRVPDRSGGMVEVTVGYPRGVDFASMGNPAYLGCTAGRFANRIAGGTFTLDDKTRRLECNDGENHLHGGKIGFGRRLWSAEPVQDRDGVGIRFELDSPDGDEGYPGELHAVSGYTLDREAGLHLWYEAWTDAPTVLNLTNHTYWNLAGGGLALDHRLRLSCHRYLEVGPTLIPTGRILPVEGTALDFREARAVGERIRDVGIGYDHCYVVDGGGGADPVPAATLMDPASGRVMTVATTQPGIQLYSGNYMDGLGFQRHQAVCLETQLYPDSPNHPGFPSAILRPGQVYRQRTIHRFSQLT